ncbi:MAG: hypothetical protein R3272_11400, partial [Candidatus Promineifilaceae bacterium]|nr:hypothetical protein [Candidatus Promineifilaceae bacterium]
AYPQQAVDPGVDEGTLALWSRAAGADCSEWTQVAGSSANASTNTVIASVTDLDRQYTIAATEPPPTALNTMPMSARLAQEPLWMVVLLALLTVAAGATYWLTRRQTAAPATSFEDEVLARLRRLDEEPE